MSNKPFDAIIETPKGSGAKYAFDQQTGHAMLNEIMPVGLAFPFDFGFIPGTIGGDGDPIDVMVISELPTFSGCVIPCRIIGCITAMHQEAGKAQVRNDQIIGIPAVSKLYKDVKEISDLPKEIIIEVESFFVNYNGQAGKKFTPLKHLKSEKAIKMLQKGKQQKTAPGQLIQLFLPLNDNQNKKFPVSYYTQVKNKLTNKFGGVTVFSRAATGLWKDEDNHTVSDAVIIFEVMADEIDAIYWQACKESLQRKFKQDEILIRRSEIGTL